MKYRFKILLVGLLFLSGWGHAQSVEKRLQKLIDSVYRANPSAIGIMVHLESPELGISWSGASGHSSKAAETELDPIQPALIASNMKTYVSAAILRLVEEGELSIHQSIDTLLTQKTKRLFESDGYNLGKIEVKHLLSHTSGILDYVSDDYIEFIDKNKTHQWTRDEQEVIGFCIMERCPRFPERRTVFNA
jgi:D-alanyl-D-alanine carboxypeptidase